MNLEGKVAIVTGGAQGIGKGIVERYVKENAKVAIFDIDKNMLEATEAEMKSMGGDVITFTVADFQCRKCSCRQMGTYRYPRKRRRNLSLGRFS